MTTAASTSIERNFNVSEDRAWYGHSFGGLFGLYALFHNDGPFKRFIIGNPSIWEAKDVIQSSTVIPATMGRGLRYIYSEKR